MDIPETLGKYRIDALLGQGAMGIVYKGFDTVLERQVAIKIVRKELLAETDTVAYLVRFKREALAAGRFLHPNIVAVYDYADRSEEHTSELQSLMRISYAVFCLKKKTNN